MRAPIGSHCICSSSQINRFADVAADSLLVRCRGRAAILVVLATFGVVCHAQMPRPDASGVTRCEIQLASCQAVLGKVGAREADGLVPRADIMAETGTSSSASKGRDCVLARSPVNRLHARAACAKTPGAARVCEASPCRSGSSALVGKNTSGAVQPTDTAQHRESNATSCAALLRDCRGHSSARRRSTSPGEPRPIAPLCLHIDT